MKKTLFLAGIATVALLASCSVEISPIDGPSVPADPSAITLDFSVDGVNGDAKAVKTGWASGDLIYIWYGTNAQQIPDLVAKFDGTAWAVDATATVSGNAPSASGTLNAVYVAAKNLADYSYDSGKFSFPVHTGIVDGQENPVKSDMVTFSSKDNYTFAANVLSATIGGWKFLSNTQVVLAGKGLDAGKWVMKCDKLKAADGFVLKDGAVAAGTASDARSYVFGQPNADGIAFSFIAESAAEQNYLFTLYDIENGVIYTYDAGARTFTSGNAGLVAKKVAKEKFYVDYYQNYLDGKDIVVGPKTINKETAPKYTLITADGSIQDLQTAVSTYDVVFIENDVYFAQNGGTVTLAVTFDTAIIGRRDNGEQPFIDFGTYKFNISQGLTLKNVRIYAGDSLFQNTSATQNVVLAVEDCTIKVLKYPVYDRNTSFDYSVLWFNNNVFSLVAPATARFMYNAAKKTTNAANYTDFTFKNNVFYLDGLDKADTGFIRINSTADYLLPNLTMTFSHNTFYNMSPIYMLRMKSLKQINFDDNVWQTSVPDGATSILLNIETPDAIVVPVPATSTCKGNYIYTDIDETNFRSGDVAMCKDGVDGAKFWTITSWNASKKGAEGDTGTLMGAIDADKLYFPVNTMKVGTAGASYDTKKWTLHDWTKVEVRSPFPGTGEEGEL